MHLRHLMGHKRTKSEQHPLQEKIKRAGLIAGPLAAALLYAILPEAYGHGDAVKELSHAARATSAVTIWMAIWWMTEAIPVFVTALLPLVLFPWLGIASGHDAAAPYGHELIFLFMGGFMIALAMERWGLHKRIALRALRLVGTKPARLVAGFMAVSAFLSMWVSNTATAIMMLPVALSLSEGDESKDDDANNFLVCLLLGIAYGCSIGGIATPIGTPPNVYLLSFLQREAGVEIGFVQWMGFGVPLAAIFLPTAWWVLTRVVFTLGNEPVPAAIRLENAATSIGAMGLGERNAAAVFTTAALAWMFRPLLVGFELAGHQPLSGITDSSIAIGAALALFILPGRPAKDEEIKSSGDLRRPPRVLDWETALRLPWGILILFGGGLSMAAAIRDTGVDSFLGSQVAGLSTLPAALVVVGVVAMLVFVTELTSNTATSATFIPLLAAVAPGLGVPPMLLVIPAAVAASFAFMLPVATPPNAVVFGSGHVRIADMSRAGLILNLLAIAAIPLVTFAIAVPLFGIGH